MYSSALLSSPLGRTSNRVDVPSPERKVSSAGQRSQISPTTEKTAQTLGLTIRIANPRPDQMPSRREANPAHGEDAVLVRRTLRSGFSLQHVGHVVVIGDVNPGAEIIASGNIVVWGRLHGLVHAGAEGNENSLVCALDLSPTQLRIAGRIAVTPKRRGKPQPETARLKDGQVTAEPWVPKRERR